MRARNHIEFLDAVIFVGGFFGRPVTLALLCDDVDQTRPFGGIANVFENWNQVIHIMPVDRPDVIKAELFEKCTAHRHTAREFVSLFQTFVNWSRQFARQTLGKIAKAEELATRNKACEIGRKTTHWRRNRHVIVVKDNNQAVARLRRVVHRFIGHARRHRAITDDRNRFARLVVQFVGDCKAQRRADRGRAVRRTEGIIVALGTLGEA